MLGNYGYTGEYSTFLLWKLRAGITFCRIHVDDYDDADAVIQYCSECSMLFLLPPYTKTVVGCSFFLSVLCAFFSRWDRTQE